MAQPYCLSLHGGAGAFARDAEETPIGRQKLSALSEALGLGVAVLRAGGAALQAVVAAVQALEDAAVFNAGRGSVLRADGLVEMDASVMCGASARAGAVASVRRLQHPVAAALHLLQDGPEVMLCGAPADERGAAVGLATRPRDHFVTAQRRTQWLSARAQGGMRLAYESAMPLTDPSGEGQTVGAVALDRMGHLAAATSTGGLTNAASGRVGDSPILGAGTWASERCAVSATGDGEVFLRAGFAHGIDARLHHAGEVLQVAVRAGLDRVAELCGAGGCVAVDCNGLVSMQFNTAGMARAFENHRGERQVALL